MVDRGHGAKMGLVQIHDETKALKPKLKKLNCVFETLELINRKLCPGSVTPDER